MKQKISLQRKRDDNKLEILLQLDISFDSQTKPDLNSGPVAPRLACGGRCCATFRVPPAQTSSELFLFHCVVHNWTCLLCSDCFSTPVQNFWNPEMFYTFWSYHQHNCDGQQSLNAALGRDQHPNNWARVKRNRYGTGEKWIISFIGVFTDRRKDALSSAAPSRVCHRNRRWITVLICRFNVQKCKCALFNSLRHNKLVYWQQFHGSVLLHSSDRINYGVI